MYRNYIALINVPLWPYFHPLLLVSPDQCREYIHFFVRFNFRREARRDFSWNVPHTMNFAIQVHFMHSILAEASELYPNSSQKNPSDIPHEACQCLVNFWRAAICTLFPLKCTAFVRNSSSFHPFQPYLHSLNYIFQSKITHGTCYIMLIRYNFFKASERRWKYNRKAVPKSCGLDLILFLHFSKYM